MKSTQITLWASHLVRLKEMGVYGGGWRLFPVRAISTRHNTQFEFEPNPDQVYSHPDVMPNIVGVSGSTGHDWPDCDLSLTGVYV